MLEHEYDEAQGINIVRASEPFHLDELYALVSATPDNTGGGTSIGKPVLLDFRGVQLERLKSEEIRAFIKKKKAPGKEVTDVLCAYVVDGPASYATIRMATIYSEISDVSSEDHVYISTDEQEAIEWLLGAQAAADTQTSN